MWRSLALPARGALTRMNRRERRLAVPLGYHSPKCGFLIQSWIQIFPVSRTSR